jgi:chromate reductase
MPTPRRVAVFIGSLRRGSYTRKIARTLIDLAPPGLHSEEIPIDGLSLYNQDADEHPPEAWADFRRRVKAVDGFLFCTPEYNRSVPGVLKNAIDIGSRPYGSSAWEGKPGAIVSVSPSAIGGFGANHHLRQSMVFLNVPIMQQPEAYIGGAARLYDEEGRLTNDTTREFLRKFMMDFDAWVRLHTRTLPA